MDDKINLEHCKHIMSCIEQYFGKYIIFSFICGSRANDNWQIRSDVDFVTVVKDHTPLRHEDVFFDAFIDYHNKHGLHNDHCGEILHIETLNHIFYATPNYLKLIPEIKKTFCYTNSCILSGFRKGRIIMGMFAGRKILAKGNQELLRHYTHEAIAYFKHELKSERHNKHGAEILSGKSCPLDSNNLYQEHLNNLVMNGVYKYTPIGINLKLWFNYELKRYSSNDFLSNSLGKQCSLSVAKNLYKRRTINE